MSDFKSLHLLPAVMEAIKQKGYTTPTPIQTKAIPHILKRKDLLGIAQTGSGKTAAFTLPILTHLANNKIKTKPARVRALIIAPTRELASQIDTNIKSYSGNLRLKSSAIFGGVGYRPQIMTMSKGVDILVATPGRLLDLINDGHVLFEQLEIFVLDEADRMLEMGFINDIKKIIEKLPKEKQTLLFSATMPDEISALANSLLQSPETVEVSSPNTTVETVEQTVSILDRSNKPLLLKKILKDRSVTSALVFTRTKRGADRVVKHLQKASLLTAAIHGDKSQGARERALKNFRSGKIKVLVATDIAARGIDIPDVSHVINYNLPEDPKSYLHRIGRTARAGRTGKAISFCDERELYLLNDIEEFLGEKIPIDTTQPFHGAAPNHSHKKR